MHSATRRMCAAAAMLFTGLISGEAAACEIVDGQYVEVTGELHVDDGGGRYWILDNGQRFCGNQESAGIEVRVWGLEEVAYSCRGRWTTVSGVYSTARSNALGEHLVPDSLHCS